MGVASSHGYKPTLSETLCRWLYSIVLALAIPFAFIHLLLKGAQKSKGVNRRRFERFGLVAKPQKQNGYLFHCVSVGEVVAASCVIKRIMQEEPDAQITVTTTTPTGSARVTDIFADTVHHFYLPYDLPFTMSAMLNRVKPKAVMITEVELWPNLIDVCWKRDIPVFVINARMTDRSARRYKKISKLFNPMLAKLSHVCAQGQRDFKNYAWLGVDQDKLTLTNNIKFDQAASVGSTSINFLGLKDSESPVFVAGSTHDGEESEIIEAVKTLWEIEPQLRVVIVPRHPERFESAAKLLEKHGLQFVRSSVTEKVPDHVNVVLLDQMGKLNNAYAVASFAFVGGSIADKGGHNALEPAAFSLPILMGPHTYNNPVICDYLQDCGALYIVENAAQIASKVATWLESPSKAVQAGDAGKKVLQDNSGALDSTLSCIYNYVS
ncbi:lipid IV(A) 3-deoxy-D-manno-octulosonic acid transferase [Alteromonas gracilis]|uniref:lipid IV(A) 3-deoxy-D-manno-octulosonic acid transferase n=1 Tax=Alteromonas gracilis TaxID=1479524 RepID=UPI00373515C2